MIERLTVPLLLAALIAGAEPAKADPALLIHGTNCGPGNKAPLPPIAPLDAACARHDACWPSSGLPARAWIRANGEADALTLANDSQSGPSSTVFARDPERGVRFALGVEAGMTHVNDHTVDDSPTGPFGGEKNSGMAGSAANRSSARSRASPG